ncbi:aspartic peptidase domain-containing protein [Suillus spraguei]|nr:aspartic peptidase domain-containing protein [Suillus spraguei]
MFSAALLTLLLVFSVTGSPVQAGNSPISVPLTSRLHFSNGTNNLLARDRARVKALRDPSMRGQNLANVPLRNDGLAYSLAVGIGNPPKTYNLLLDSGSANTWVRTEWLDYVTIGPGLTVVMQSIGVAAESAGFDDFDGIIGIGPVASTPYGSPPLETTGQITFGGTDPTKCNSNIAYTIDIRGSRNFGGTKSRITYGNEEILTSTVGIVDSGCTFILIARDAYLKYRWAAGAKYDRATELLTISKKQYGALRNLNFRIGEQTYSLTRNAQIWPRSINSQIGGTRGSIYLVCDLGTCSLEEDDFSLGYVFMQRFYVAYDATNSLVGLATTAFTDATTN